MGKLEKLKSRLKRMGSVLLAYSGGVDSTFLLKVAHDCLGEKLLAVTANSATYPKEELIFSKQTARALGVRHKIIRTNELADKKFSRNPPNRCYFCKKELFRRLRQIAQVQNLNFVIDATNFSDKRDLRPGKQAKKELGVRSPLEEVALTKEDIRYFSKRLGLVTWDKPSQACLASRLPYGRKISLPVLKRIHQAELFLRKLGAKQVRLRHYDSLCRIETLPEDIPRLVSQRDKIVEKLKALGYDYVTVDLQGYRSGSLNETVSDSIGKVGEVERCFRKKF